MTDKRRVLYVQYTTPTSYTILGHGARILVGRGWQVKFLGIRTRGSANNLKLPVCDGIFEECMNYCDPGIFQKFHYLRYCIWVCVTAVFWRPKIVYCSERASTPIGLFLASVLKIRVVYHEHDPARSTNTLFDRVLMACRRRLAKRAIACVIPNQDRFEAFVGDLGPKKALMVWNAVSLDEVQQPTDLNSNGPLKLWYQGTINPSQIPLTIIDSIAQTIGVELAFVGFGRDEYVKEILERSKSLGISDRVLFLGTPATRAELYDLSRNRHVGLVLFEIPFRDSMAGASQKPFEYMAAGMALLVPDVAEWNSFAIQRGYGLGCLPNNVSNLAQTLRTLHDNRQMVLEMGRRARGRILQEWNYECLFSPVVDLMEQDT